MSVIDIVELRNLAVRSHRSWAECTAKNLAVPFDEVEAYFLAFNPGVMVQLLDAMLALSRSTVQVAMLPPTDGKIH